MSASVDSESRVRLFKVSTVMARYQGHKDVEFHWFMLNRAQPVASYQILIAGYEYLDRLEQLHLENLIDEAFTAQEIQALGAYLKEAHKSALVVEELTLPIQDTSLININALPALGRQDIYMLSEDTHYGLPFKVYGRFDLSQHEAIDEDQDEVSQQQLGVLYLQAALKALGVAEEMDLAAAEGEFSEARLSEVASKLRKEQGFHLSGLPEQENPTQPEIDDVYLLKAYLSDRP